MVSAEGEGCRDLCRAAVVWIEWIGSTIQGFAWIGAPMVHLERARDMVGQGRRSCHADFVSGRLQLYHDLITF
jgi:hypothetical protein